MTINSLKAKEKWFLKTYRNIILEILKMVNLMGSVYIIIKMVIFMRESGKIIKDMVKEKCLFKWV